VAATGSYVSPFDNAHGTGTTTTFNMDGVPTGTVNNDGSTMPSGYPLSITTPLLYPPGSTAGTREQWNRSRAPIFRRPYPVAPAISL